MGSKSENKSEKPKIEKKLGEDVKKKIKEGKKKHPTPGILNGIPKVLLYTSAVVLSLAFALTMTYFIVPSRIEAVEFDLGTPLPLEGVLSINDRLSKAEIFFEDQVYGPECIAVDKENNLIYAGLKTGLIVEIDLVITTPKITKAVRLTSMDNCDGSYKSMPKCGRPLGLRFNEFGELLVADAYLGLYAIDWNKEKVMKILGAGELITNDPSATPLRYLNDFDFLPDGRIVLSESSTKFDDRDFLYDLFEHRPNGRILVYEPRKKDLRVLKDGLYFPNGVQVLLEKGVTKDDDIRVFFSEMGMTRIVAIWAPTDHFSQKRAKTKVLIDKLPGYPDNIRLTSDGQLLVPLASQRSSDDSYIEKKPRLREFLTKVLSPQALAFVADFLSETDALILKIDPTTGTIVDSLHDPTGKVSSVSTVVEDSKGRLLMGSDSNYFIARA